jgi:serine/threonine-protein kinase
LGPVFRACEPESERTVAVKLFRLDLPPERAHLLAGEFDRLIGSKLGHPAIAAPIATGITVTSAYLVQEFVDGESLDVAMRSRAAGALADAICVAERVAAALDHAAAAGITHGALHPRDVLIAEDGAHLTGLGVAKALERAGAVAPVRRPYAPPERAAGVSWDHRCDVFSLATLVYELLWARRVTASGEHVARAMTELPGADLGALRRAFGRALASDPADRFETAAGFVEALRAAGSDTAASLPELLPFVRRDRRPRMAAGRTERRASGTGAALAPLLPLDSPVEAAAADGLVAVAREREAVAAAVPAESFASSPILPPSEGASSGLVPLALTGVLFLVVGFAAGYGIATWRSPAASEAGIQVDPVPVPQELVAAPAVPTADPAFTETPAAAPPLSPPAATEPPAPALADPPAPPPVRGRLVVRSTPSGARAVQPAPRPTPAAQRSVQVESRPAGASVYLDGRLVGRTPLVIGDVGNGVHAVSLELYGYRRWTSSVRVGAGGRQRVAASLELEMSDARGRP